jgi:hypothetical protein
VVYLLLVVGLRRWYRCWGGRLWVITGITASTFGCTSVITMFFCILLSSSVGISSISSSSILLFGVLPDIWVVLRQLHGLLLCVGVHPSSFVIAVVVIIVVVIVVATVNLHKLRSVLRLLLLRLLLLRLVLLRLFRWMVDQVGRCAGSLANGLPGPGHL